MMLRSRLKKTLKDRGITAYRLAKDLNIDRGQLSRFFNGKGGLSLKKLEQIAHYLGYEITMGRKDKTKNIKSSQKLAEGKIEEIIEEFETRYEVYLRDITYDAGKVKLTYEEGTIGRPKMKRPPEEPFQKPPKPPKPKDWKPY